MTFFSWLTVPALILGFVLLWRLACLGAAFVSGWTTLARFFRATAVPSRSCPWFLLQSGRLNAVPYRNCLHVSLLPQGLYISVVPLFGRGHAPLLIPWPNLGSFQPQTVFGKTSYRSDIMFGADQNVCLALDDKHLVDAIASFSPS